MYRRKAFTQMCFFLFFPRKTHFRLVKMIRIVIAVPLKIAEVSSDGTLLDWFFLELQKMYKEIIRNKNPTANDDAS